MQERDERGAVRVVLNRGYAGRYAGLVTLEVNDPIMALVAAATMPDGYLAQIVAA